MESLILTVSSFLIGGTILFFYAKSRNAPKDQSQKVNELVEEIKVLKDHVVVAEMNFKDQRQLSTGIILPADNGKNSGINV